MANSTVPVGSSAAAVAAVVAAAAVAVADTGMSAVAIKNFCHHHVPDAAVVALSEPP